jgi:hypothetical protein
VCSDLFICSLSFLVSQQQLPFIIVFFVPPIETEKKRSTVHVYRMCSIIPGCWTAILWACGNIAQVGRPEILFIIREKKPVSNDFQLAVFSKISSAVLYFFLSFVSLPANV